MTLRINAAFDSGNIEVAALERAGDGWQATLDIARDGGSAFYQWFHFRVSGADGAPVALTIRNAGGSAYPFGWPGYRVRASTDRVMWRMIPTRYADGVLSFDWHNPAPLAWFAYFEPYTLDRHDALIARIAAAPGVIHRELGRSLDGRAIDCLSVGGGPKPVWLYARQHPGESMAEWWMEGALERLIDPVDPVAAALRRAATIHCVPNMNPDGSFRGHLRTNAAGVNLNREWHAPSPERSPEVLGVRDAMDASGVAFAMDIHGDEAIPANFLAGFEGIPSLRTQQSAAYDRFQRELATLSIDFQTERGYDRVAPGRANLTMSTNQLAERYGAVSMTLEMPFKDHDPNPDAIHGWSGARSKTLARDCLDVLARMIDTL